MAKPKVITLKKKEQQTVLSKFKSGFSARKIASELELPRYQVMALLESKKLAKFSEGSYN